MPRGDGTGPNGEGPMTGRRAGNCGNGNMNSLARPKRNIDNRRQSNNRISRRRSGGNHR